MSKIKGVIQVIDSLNAGGAEVLAVNIANGLSKAGENSHICVTREEGELKNNISKKNNYLFLKKKRTIDFFAIYRFIVYINKNSINIIHAHASSYFFAFCIKLFYPKVSIVWHDHYGKSQDLDSRELFPLNICSYFFHSIVSVNSDLKKWAEKSLNCKRVDFLNNFAVFTNTESITNLKGIYGKRIVHLAAFREQKDHLNLLEAFKIINKKYPEYTLHLIGKIHENKYSKKIRTFVKKGNLTGSVFFYDVCLDIKNILNQSNIGVLSSKSEGLPVSLLEYGLANLPVLVTDVGECKKVINHNKAIVVAENSDFFATHMIELIENLELRNEISTILNKNINDFFSEKKFINKIKKVYLNE
ncbi:glycosyltransferase [Polaribacter sp. Asnod1-A03]|uniref:glycosyltransferase n=1 Tax=Polaribacter sp. Asnod1-A03 TaxID=3160581 RepID=UPI0038640E00